jgi:enterochelin esterase-like enzyme
VWLWLVALLAFVAAQAEPGTLVPPEMMASAAGPMVVTVWLPPGYGVALAHYPVVYMQDGQNLFEAAGRATSWNRHTWGADRVAAGLIAEGRIPAVIIVGVDHRGLSRARQYYPQKPFARLDPARQQVLATLNGGAPTSDAYLGFLVNQLKPVIDARYRTKPERAATFIMGSSMGGLISLYALTEYPSVFGGAGCLSTHWLMATPIPSAPPPEPLFAAYEGYLRDKKPAPGRIWFDHGTAGLDAGYGPYQTRVDALLVGLGWRPGVDFVSKTYPGADHNEDAWRARLADSLRFLLGTN